GGRVKLTNLIRPVPNGVSVGNNLECAAGTLGTGVIIGAQTYALSNNHVFARENDGHVGEVIVQPGRFDSKPRCADKTPESQLGTLFDFEPIDFAAGNNTFDAAIAPVLSRFNAAICQG